MLQVRTEYKKGVLFVRLKGRHDNASYLKKINWIIEEIGIKFVVLNITNLTDISLKSIKKIIDYRKKLIKEKRLLIICDNNPLRNTILKSSTRQIKKEIDAFTLINRKDVYE